jgi:hypothetical protein
MDHAATRSGKDETKSESNVMHGTAPGQRPVGIVFRLGGRKGTARFTPYIWLSHVDYEVGREIKLDFSRYDVVLRCTETYALDSVFEAICRNECSEISEKEGALTIEIVEKDEVGVG